MSKRKRKPRRQYPPDAAQWGLDEFHDYHLVWTQSPDGKAWARLWEIFNAAVIDPAIIASPQIERYAQLVRDLLGEWLPGDALEDILRPLETMLAARHSTGKGGRPTVDVPEDWLRKYEELRARRPGRTKSDICRQIARDWVGEDGERRSPRTVERHVTRLQKVRQNPPLLTD